MEICSAICAPRHSVSLSMHLARIRDAGPTNDDGGPPLSLTAEPPREAEGALPCVTADSENPAGLFYCLFVSQPKPRPKAEMLSETRMAENEEPKIWGASHRGISSGTNAHDTAHLLLLMLQLLLLLGAVLLPSSSLGRQARSNPCIHHCTAPSCTVWVRLP